MLRSPVIVKIQYDFVFADKEVWTGDSHDLVHKMETMDVYFIAFPHFRTLVSTHSLLVLLLSTVNQRYLTALL